MSGVAGQGVSAVKVIVVGAGIIGAVSAFRLAQAGAEVVVIEAGLPGCAASGASFGWINASFHADADHFRLRAEGIAAHHRLATTLKSRAFQWSGCLCWETAGAEFDAQLAALATLGYPVRVVDAAQFARLEPQIPPPDRALHFPDEGVVDLPVLAAESLRAALALGARLIAGVAVERLVEAKGRISGVQTAQGVIAADRVVLAAGTGCEVLLAGVEVPLPMLRRPGLILRSRPMPPVMRHVLVNPDGEMRQLADGCLLVPAAVGHQGDDSEETGAPDEVARSTATRVAGAIGHPVDWQQVTLAWRPVPLDGLPVIGACGPQGLYVATMHSGATLAAIAGELVAMEVMETQGNQSQAALVAPYRPQRFTA